jgi:hypothetical protein
MVERAMRTLAAVAAALCIAALARSAQAQRVALVRPANGDPILLETFNRLTAELRIQEFEVSVVEAPPEARPPETLETVARRIDAVASVALVRYQDRTAVDVWLDDRRGGPPIVRRLEPMGGTELPNVLAIRAVDLLRVSLREFGPDSTVRDAPRTEHPAAAETGVPPARVRPWEIRAEGIALFDSPHIGVAIGPGLGLARHLSGPFRVGILLSGPLVGASWATSAGTAAIRQNIGLADVRISWWRSDRIDLGASISIGAHYLIARGTATPPLLSRSDDVWSLAAGCGADGSFRLTSNAGLALGVRAIGLTPRPGVGVGHETTVLEFPVLSASAGLLVGF